jgi:hypothetical protein
MFTTLMIAAFGRSVFRAIVLSALTFLPVVAPSAATAQSVELTVFAGRAYPTFDDRLVLRAPSVPTLPDVEVTPVGTPELRTDGGPVFGASLALHAGIIGLEARLDMTDIGFDVTGARYDLRATAPPLEGLTGSVGIGDGRVDVERLNLLSLNLRLRTPGPVGFIASGGLSYLPDINVVGSVPITVQIAGLPVVPGVAPRLRLVAAPGQADHRWGVNAGAGIRLGGRVALIAEARVFYFRTYELRPGLEVPVAFLSELIDSIDPIRFEPIILNAQAGVTFRF